MKLHEQTDTSVKNATLATDVDAFGRAYRCLKVGTRVHVAGNAGTGKDGKPLIHVKIGKAFYLLHADGVTVD